MRSSFLRLDGPLRPLGVGPRCVGLLVVGAACAPKDFQYEARGDEQRRLAVVATRFASGDVDARLLDLDGRKALLIFGASLAYEQRERVRAAVNEAGASVVVALALQVLGGWTQAQSEGAAGAALARASRDVEAQLEREFGVSAKRLLGGEDVLATLAAQVREPPGAAAERLLTRLRGELPRGCAFARVVVSYDVRFLRWTAWEHADRSQTFTAWKRRARSLHLAEVACDGEAGVVLLSVDEHHEAPRVVGWRFSNLEQHERLLARLRASR